MSSVRRGPLAADNFTIISNAIIRDAALSLKARGLAAWLLSHSEDWELSVRSIADQTGTGVEAVQTALKELENAGYLVRHQETASGGQFGAMVYEIRDVSPGGTAHGFPVHGSPASGAPGHRETGTHKKTNSKNTKTQKTTTAADAPEGEEKPAAKAPRPELDPASPLPKPDPSKTMNQRANVLAGRQYERLGKMGNVPAFAKIIKKALEHGYDDGHVDRVLAYLADQRWTLTEEKLANLLRGGPRLNGARPPQQTTRAKARTANGMEIQS